MPLSDDQLSSIPKGLRERRQWVLWRYEKRSSAEKPTKVPYQSNGAPANHAQPLTWATFDDAVAAYRSGGYSGIGFVFTQSDPYVGGDLDNCFTPDGTLKSWAVDIVTMAQEAECYIERTPSGNGLHIIGMGKLPGRGRKVTGLGEDRTGAIELYDQLRYFTVTGDQTDIGDADGDVSALLQWVWRQYQLTDDASAHVEPGAEIADSEADQIARVILERASADFRSLWVDLYDVKQHGTDRSSVRMGFLNKLAMKLKGDGRQLSVALVRAVALRSPFIKSEMSANRGKKWPRLANAECAEAIRWANDKLGEMPAEPPGQPMLVLTLSELNTRASALRWAVKGIIPEASVGMIFGASGAFKSFLALDYALHRAWGLRWLNRRTKQAPQVYLAAEGGAGVMRRIIAWHNLRGLDWRKCPMYVVPVPMVLRAQAKQLARAIKAVVEAPGDIVVDTLAQTYDGDENSASEMSAWLRVVGADLRDAFDATVLIIHHSGHSATERPRGSSAIMANVDFLYGCFRDEQQMIATLECVKQKDGDKPEPFNFELHRAVLGKDEDGDEISSLAARHIDSAGEVLAAAKRSRSGALNRLLEAIDGGRPAKEVRLAFYSAMSDATPEAKKKAFQRAVDHAKQAGVLLMEGDWMSVAAQQTAEADGT